MDSLLKMNSNESTAAELDQTLCFQASALICLLMQIPQRPSCARCRECVGGQRAWVSEAQPQQCMSLRAFPRCPVHFIIPQTSRDWTRSYSTLPLCSPSVSMKAEVIRLNARQMTGIISCIEENFQVLLLCRSHILHIHVHTSVTLELDVKSGYKHSSHVVTLPRSRNEVLMDM